MLKEKLTKKKLMITLLVILAIIIFICIICILAQAENSEQGLIILNDKLAMGKYKITLKTDKLTSTIIRYDTEACKEEKNNTTTFKQYTKDGNSYILTNDTNKIYEYPNNDNILYEIIEPLSNLQDYEYSTGSEKINGKNFKYREYDDFDQLLLTPFENTDETTQTPKTRLYFSGKNLKYIKTIQGKNEELIEVNISFKVDKEDVQIPSDADIVQIDLTEESSEEDEEEIGELEKSEEITEDDIE